jgi:glycosyltransferase involved in cell wall biosynthesis
MDSAGIQELVIKNMNDLTESDTVLATRPRISVCMASYNVEKFIARQLQTILSQLMQDDEVVISDDSSTDKTLELIKTFHDKRIRLFGGQTFRSPIYNFEHALKQASGEIIFLSDQDDEWVDGWVETALGELQDVSLVVCDADVIGPDGRAHPAYQGGIYPNGGRRPGILQNLYRNGYIGCCCAFRREVLEVALPFPARLPWHDWWIGLVADTFFSTKFIRERKIRYRRHGANASPTGEESTSTIMEKVRMRWNLGSALIMRKLVR